MKHIIVGFAVSIILIFLAGCSTGITQDPISTGTVLAGMTNTETANHGQYLNWGNYQFVIDRKGAWAEVVPLRSSALWGIHLNALKLLENHPCSDCVKLKNIHLLDNGDVSVDIEITHPWPYNNQFCTGFDVRGIIMLPSSQEWPDNELRNQAGLEPYEGDAYDRWPSSDKGDAELINAEGWTTLWAPDIDDYGVYIPEGFPIFEYYPGHMASGTSIGTRNPFIRYYSNENRHMFEVGESVTRTYKIRPPAQGNIEACYAVYAHWAVPVNTPVVDPAVDFPPEANSPMPYEFWVTQDEVLDPDAPPEELGSHIHWHIKIWHFNLVDETLITYQDLMYEVSGGCGTLPHPGGEPDDYYLLLFDYMGYEKLPDPWPGDYLYIFRVETKDPTSSYYPYAGIDYYMTKIAFEESDGTW